MSNPWASIKDKIDQAEKGVPAQDVSAVVAREALPLPDPDEENYKMMRGKLTDIRRAKLEADYRLWQAAIPLMEQLISLASGLHIETGFLSPGIRRLIYRPLKAPRYWRICQTCNGCGEGELSYCIKCSGDGYVV